MELSWELELLRRATAPDVVLDGRRLLHRVSDLLQHEDGAVEALIRGEVPQVVRIPGRFPLEDISCSCGATGPLTPCEHSVAVRLRELQVFHGLDDARTTRWVRQVESLQRLEVAWGSLANVWLDAFAYGDDAATRTVLGDAGSLHGGIQVFRALERRASGEQLSEFLLQLATEHDVDGASPLTAAAALAAHELAVTFCRPDRLRYPAACTGILLALVVSARRSVGVPNAAWSLEWIVDYSCGALGQLVVDDHADAVVVAEALLQAELESPSASYPWSAHVLEALGGGARPVASAMRVLLQGHEPSEGWATADDPRSRLRAELGFASEGVAGLVPVLEEWPAAPYGEFLQRLPLSDVPTARLALLESAHRSGAVRWSPGWAYRSSVQLPPVAVRRPMERRSAVAGQSAVALGDLVVAEAQIGRADRARTILREHAQRDAGPAHRYEFVRIWETAKLGPGVGEDAVELFGPEPANEHLGKLLAAIARIPEVYFRHDLPGAGQGVGMVLLAAILLEDTPPEGRACNLDAAGWATGFFDMRPMAADDLTALAALPVHDFALELEGVVLDQHLALRVWRVAGQLVEGSRPVRSIADVRAMGVDAFLGALERVPDATPLTAGLVGLLLGDARHASLEDPRREFLRKVLAGEAPADGAALLERSYSIEPRGEDIRGYQLAVVLAERDERVPHSRSRT